jgi:serine/threonine protein kinase
MGEVYRAKDTKLGRDVAIKVLPELVATDPERLARFHREAQVLASLNHPNIAAIYGFEDSNNTHALVMELVEGPTLADRIVQGPIPLNEALPIAKQIAEALEAAHEQGIIHRDLKPANIKVREDGTVKILDFGLAKLVDPVSNALNVNVTASPTITTPAMMTGVGVVLGTAAYMSPEQARGKAVDRRADVWAFGCVLLEMLTGARTFAGEEVSDTLAFILTKEPDWTALPPDVPSAVRRLLRRCLQKDPKQRLRSAGDALLELDEALVSPDVLRSPTVPTVPKLSGARSLAWGLAVLGMIGMVATLWLTRRPGPQDPNKVAFDIPTDASPSPLIVSLSPDGTSLVVPIATSQGASLWLRRLDQVEGRFLSAPVGLASDPFWSPDGRYIGYFSGGKLTKLDLSGAPTESICAAPTNRGGTWNRAGVILFGTTDGPLFSVSATGGTPTPVTELDKTRRDTSHRFPIFLPDGNHFIFLLLSNDPQNSGLYLGSLGSKTAKLLIRTESKGAFAPPNHLLFVREGVLMGQPFNPTQLEVAGDPSPIVEGIGVNSGNSTAGFAVSNNGTLAFRVGAGNTFSRVLRWIDRSGKPLGDVGESVPRSDAVIAPNGQQAAEFRPEGQVGDIWLVDLFRGSSTRFTFDPELDGNPVWSPDGKRIAFSSSRDGGVRNLYVKAADGSGQEQLLLKTRNAKVPTDWSKDGRALLYTELAPTGGGADVWVLPLEGDRKPVALLHSLFPEDRARFSPDAQWIAYTSDESGRAEVYVQSTSGGGGKWQVSTTGGIEPHWRGDGREIFYASAGSIWAVDVVAAASSFKAGVPRRLFDATILTSVTTTAFDVSPDGQRFLVSVPSAQPTGSAQRIRVLLNGILEAGAAPR